MKKKESDKNILSKKIN